uniref:Uncharacterized protein n=1 Tax=Grammatophora oceanica TaxID=210454 RepID=A0A7S1V9N2_9STRA|mmetsp:Transcript_40681/g.60292  ORF Transcript_40681/g.60292 Transcript_40681/m.60292 type:complete len:271 (+) Transcript_40681:386-1198(+)
MAAENTTTPTADPKTDDAGGEEAANIHDEKPVLYVNVFLEDVSEAVKEGVAEKLAEKNLPPPLKERLTKRLCHLAADMVKAEKIVEKMAPKMCEEMPIKMKAKGITVVAEEVYRGGPFFVLMLQVQHVDAALMVEAQQEMEKEQPKESWTTKASRGGLNMVGLTVTDPIQSGYLPSFVQSKMQPEMGPMMQAELAEKKLKASCEVLGEDKEARFFFAMVSRVRAEGEAKVAEKKKSFPLPLAGGPFGKKSQCRMSAASCCLYDSTNERTF